MALHRLQSRDPETCDFRVCLHLFAIVCPDFSLRRFARFLLVTMMSFLLDDESRAQSIKE
jgi:hypothetical protein